MNKYRNIPDHEHTHSLYVRCNSCKTFGVDTPTDFTEVAECGNCGSMDTVKYYPSCCILADREELQKKIKDLQASLVAVLEDNGSEPSDFSDIVEKLKDYKSVCLKELKEFIGNQEDVPEEFGVVLDDDWEDILG